MLRGAWSFRSFAHLSTVDIWLSALSPPPPPQGSFRSLRHCCDDIQSEGDMIGFLVRGRIKIRLGLGLGLRLRALSHLPRSRWRSYCMRPEKTLWNYLVTSERRNNYDRHELTRGPNLVQRPPGGGGGGGYSDVVWTGVRGWSLQTRTHL